MFGKLKGLIGNKGSGIGSPAEGRVIPISQVNDPTFSEEILGKGAGVEPSGNQIYSPVTGVVTQMFDTGHAVSLTSEDGAEILVHVGIDTVQLKGKHYTAKVKSGQKVQAGDLLIEFDREAIAAEGYETVTLVVICNTDDYKEVAVKSDLSVKPGDEIIRLSK